MVDILSEMGELFLGSRLKRLAERLQSDAGQLAQDAGLDIQPAQFALLAAIDRYGPLSVGDAAGALGVSQPSVTRTVTGLVELGLLCIERSEMDLRQRTMSLTDAGRRALRLAKVSMWPQLEKAVRGLCAPLSGGFLDQISQIEAALDQMGLEERAKSLSPKLTIHEYTDDLAADFYRINSEWISSMFSLEENDISILTRPRELIIDQGGIILFVEAEGLGIIGTCALIRIDEGIYELTKMAVLESARGRKAGEYLLVMALERARSMAMETLYLLTNKKSASAVHLYEKLGFVHDSEIMRAYGSRYERCDIAMRYSG